MEGNRWILLFLLISQTISHFSNYQKCSVLQFSVWSHHLNLFQEIHSFLELASLHFVRQVTLINSIAIMILHELYALNLLNTCASIHIIHKTTAQYNIPIWNDVKDGFLFLNKNIKFHIKGCTNISIYDISVKNLFILSHLLT